MRASRLAVLSTLLPALLAAQDLSGHWTDQRGSAYEILEQGNRLTITTSRRVFEGERTGGGIAVFRLYRSLEDVPAPLRERYGERLIGDRAGFRGGLAGEDTLRLTLSASDAIGEIPSVPLTLTRRTFVLTVERVDGPTLSSPAGTAAEPMRLDAVRPFRVEVAYTRLPRAPPAEIAIRWDGGQRTVELRAGPGSGTFVTPWLRLTTREPARPPFGLGLPEANSPRSKGYAAELLANRWEVTQGRESGPGETGVALVSGDGADVRLVLSSSQGQTRYRAFETLVTRDPAGAQHTATFRFDEVGSFAAAEDEDRDAWPDGEPVRIAEGTQSITVDADGVLLAVPVDSSALARRIRVALMARGPGRFAGTWSWETPDGRLGDGGKQTWSRGAAIGGARVYEDQGRALYPFRASSPGPATRTLFVWGENLPVSYGDAREIHSADSLIAYEVAALPGERDGQFEDGWTRAGVTDRTGLSALVLTARLSRGVLPGVKRLTINGTPAVWILSFADARGKLGFAHESRENEFEPAAALLTSGIAYAVIDDAGEIPYRSLDFILRKNGTPVAEPLVLRRVGTPADAEYRSPPLRLFRSDRPGHEPPPEAGAVSVDVRPGDVLEITPVDPAAYLSVPLAATARVIDDPGELGGLWVEALARVAACHGDRVEDVRRLSGQEAETYSRFILTRLGSATVRVNKGDQAAAILIRDELAAMLEREILPVYRRLAAAPDDSLRSFVRQTRRTGGSLLEVMQIRDTTPAGVRAALDGFIGVIEGAVGRARAAGDCNLVELMVLAGQRVDPITARIVPRLVKKRSDEGREYWEPDLPARGYVKELHTTGAAIRALDEYASIDNAYKGMALALATGGVAFAASSLGYAGTATYLMVGGDLADMLYFGSQGVLEHLESQGLVRYARGVSPAAGEEFLAEAELGASEWYWAALGVIAPGLGGASGLKQLKALRSTEAVARGSAVARRMARLDEAALSGLSDVERADLAALFTELHAKRLRGAAGALTDAERVDLAKFDGYFDTPAGRLRQGLPDDVRGHVPISVDDALPGRTVRVHYDAAPNGVVTNVRIVAGSGATETDIALHAATVRNLQKYEGLTGRARSLADRLGNTIGLRNPPTNSTAYVALEEVKKLPGVIDDRLRQLRSADLDPAGADDLRVDIEHLERQLRHHEKSLTAWDLSPGRGYIAAESPPRALLEEFQKAEAAVTGTLTRAVRQTGDGTTVAVTPAELRSPQPGSRYSVNGYLYATDDQGRVIRAEGELQLTTAARNATQQSEVGRAGVERPSGYVYGESDDGGHLIGSRFNGAGEALNMVPQNSALNQNGKWKALENQWAQALKDGTRVKVRIEPRFSGGSNRPDYFDIVVEVPSSTGGWMPWGTHTIRNTQTGS